MTFEPIHELVGKAIERFPDRVAVESPQGRLTYAELDERAQRIAGALRAAGAGAGSFVPVLARDCRELVASVLGILRIGGVVVPLDLSASPARLRLIVADVAPGWAVLGSAPDAVAAQVLADAAPDARTVTADPRASSTATPVTPHRATPDDPCYVFYTSGTTGRPKGIVGRLGSVTHYIQWETGLLGVTADWRIGNLVSPAFDAVMRDVFVPLSTGGTFVVPPPDTLLDPAALARWIDDARIDLVHCVPSLFRGLVDAALAADLTLSSLRCVALSGERLAPADAGRWFGRHGDRVRLLNLYGPSETTMTKTFHFLTRRDAERASVPVGRPMPDTEVLLLDERGAAVEPGTVGEIHLRTPHRSLGYLGLPEETARVFVPNPLTGDADDIVYRTGDFGRLLEDGTLEFLGRKDHQVKIGGVRVELTAVESLLRAHPAVAEAAVSLVEDAGATYLGAHLELSRDAADSDPEVLHTALREHLREHLPDSAVPAVFVPVAGLPRTLSGKIDRGALPAPVRRTVSDVRGGEPRTPVERTVADLWLGLLPVGRVGLEDAFFDSGGTSLLVVELLSRVNRAFGVSVPLRDFLRSPTISTLAEAVERELLAADAPLDDLLAI
ncbi:non-ribosomal peptide synthetase [Streptomyces sp. CB00455]|uniref:non-ribosomal peptide synthetase n=1 Tax=Streptomyces sp. CB00455 TaxID=1703927 RepID=UPI0009393972|nr:non-ribosomal peptide synthetase [Streptomyces sp. CB00455]